MKKIWIAPLVASLVTAPLIASAADTQAEIEALKKRIAALEKDSEVDISSTRNYTIGSGMQFGVGSGVYGDELYINDFGLNRDLTLLHERQFIDSRFRSFEEAPHLLISGNVSGTVGKHSHRFGIELSDHQQFMKASAEMDFAAYVNEDWLGYIQIEGDGNNDDTTVRIDQAFTTYGNFNKHPMYVTLGYQYVPFGNFTTNFIEKTEVQELGRTQVPAALGGFNYVDGPWDVNGAFFWFDGATRTSNNYRLDEVGANLQARRTELGPEKDMSIMFGASWINNLASSNGIKDEVRNGGRLDHYVPAVDMRAKFAKGPFSLTAEYLTAIRAFSQTDFTQTRVGHNPNSIKPNAAYAEAAYDFKVWGMPNTASVRYGQTRDSLAFGLPYEQYGASYQLTPFFNTRVTFEYMHKLDYDSSTTATDFAGATVTGTGKADDLFQAQINVFF